LVRVKAGLNQLMAGKKPYANNTGRELAGVSEQFGDILTFWI